MRYITVILTIAFFMVSQLNAQEAIPLDRIDKVASEALGTFHKIINEQNYQKMGFSSLDEVSRMELGQFLQVYTVRLDQLQKYDGGTDPASLLTGGELFIYPVNVKEVTRSAIMIDRMKEDWEATSYGSPNLVRMLTDERLKLVRSLNKDKSFFFAVEVPALNQYFIGYKLDGKLFLTPVMDDEGYGFKAGETMPADKVFEAMLPAARKHEGFPR